MQVSRLSFRSAQQLVTINKNVIRTVTATAVNEDVRPFEDIPGPSSLPIIGQFHHFLPGGILNDTAKIQETLYKNYGLMVRLKGLFGMDNSLFLFDPESAAFILRSENTLPIRPGFLSLNYYRISYRKKNNPDSPNGLLTDHGEKWREIRTIANPILMQPKTIRLYTSKLEGIADEMVARIKSQRDEKNMIRNDLDHVMHLWALESIGVVALGRKLNCFDPNLPEDSPEKKLIQCVLKTFAAAYDLDFRPSMWRWISTPSFRKGMKCYEEHEKLAKFFIKSSMEEVRDNQTNDGEKSILEKLFEIDEEAAYILGTDMLFAGIDTTANSMLVLLYCLAANPEKQNKLREEITSQPSQKTYMKACIKESMRLTPIAPGNVRLATKDYNLLGYKIPKDTLILIAHQAMSLMENHFPKSREFIPERWIDKESPLYYTNTHPFAYAPFGFGVRTCIGRRIAELEMESLLSKVIQNFDVKWVGPPPEVVLAPITNVIGPYNFIFKDI